MPLPAEVAYLAGAGSAGGPVHWAAAEQVQVKMPDALAGAGVAIKHRAVAEIGDAVIGGQLLRGQEELADEGGMRGLKIIQRCQVEAGNDQQVRGCLGVKVGKGNTMLILIKKMGRNFTSGNFAENTIGGHGNLLDKRWGGDAQGKWFPKAMFSEKIRKIKGE